MEKEAKSELWMIRGNKPGIVTGRLEGLRHPILRSSHGRFPELVVARLQFAIRSLSPHVFSNSKTLAP